MGGVFDLDLFFDAPLRCCRSKSRGNFVMLHEAVARWSADATRFALADAGDSLEDANFERDTADNAILRLTTEEEFVKSTLEEAAAGKLRGGELTYADRVFEARMSVCVREGTGHYEGMRFREALKSCFYEMLLARDSYRDMCIKMEVVRGGEGVRGVLCLDAVERRGVHVLCVCMNPQGRDCKLDSLFHSPSHSPRMSNASGAFLRRFLSCSHPFAHTFVSACGERSWGTPRGGLAQMAASLPSHAQSGQLHPLRAVAMMRRASSRLMRTCRQSCTSSVSPLRRRAP